MQNFLCEWQFFKDIVQEYSPIMNRKQMITAGLKSCRVIFFGKILNGSE